MIVEDTERLDVSIDLDDARIAWQPLHEALEALDAAGFTPQRYHSVPERELARVEVALGPTYGVALARGGAWIVERQTGEALPPIVGCAGYCGDGELGIAGPFALDGELAPFRSVLLLGTLFSLRERGYRRALVQGVKASALTALQSTLGDALVGRRPSLPSKRLRVAICASGSGTNFQAVIDAVAAGELALDIARLVANRPGAQALARARAADIEAKTIVWDRAAESRAAYDARVLAAVAEAAPDCVLLLGWMHLLPPPFIAAFPELYNIHPAYLPLRPECDTVILPDGTSQAAFRGARAVDDALAAGATWIGASFHHVTVKTDRGAIIGRAPLALQREEQRDRLVTRLHALEHRVVCESLARYTARALSIS